MRNYDWIWTRVLDLYKRAKLFIFVFLPTVILIIAYFLVPGFNQLLLSAHGLFVLVLGIGIFILLVDVVWFVLYQRHVVLLEKTTGALPTNCPFCGREFHIEKNEQTVQFGFPATQFKISCSFCSTQLATSYPYNKWIFINVDTVLNSTFAWLYQGEKLSREDLSLVLNRQHTENAKVKLRASGNSDLIHIWFDKPTARTITKLRTGPLEKIVSGDMTALTELNSEVLYSVADVNTYFFKQPSDLVLHKRENVILTVTPVRLAVRRTEQSEDHFYVKDSGFFFVTNQRVGFRGETHRTSLTIDSIDDLGHQADKIVIRSHHRKTADYYLDLDGELVFCVIKGLLRTNGVS